MKKILLMMLLTFTTIAHADEGRYTMTSNQEDGDISYVWVLDSEKGHLKYCWKLQFASDSNIFCSKWKDIKDYVEH